MLSKRISVIVMRSVLVLSGWGRGLCKRSLRTYCLLAIGLLVVAGGESALAQMTASMTGAVKDRSGAVIGGSNVTVTSLETGIARSASTDDAGHYRVLSLPVGRYSVKAEKEGFEATVQTGINLVIGQEAVVNLALEVGTVQQQVTVTGEAPLVDTTLSSTSGLVGEQQVKDLPLNGRSFDQLLALNVATANFSSYQAATSPSFRNLFSVAGRRPDENRFIINGVDFPGNSNAGSSAMPGGASGSLLGVDAVREFNVVQNTYGAEYGKSAGGQISIVTSSGTNRWHGDAFEFFRNSKLDARSFFDYPIGERIPPFKRNQFGAALGGPIKKDKAFFFANYEGFRQRLGISDVSIVPDAQARIGNLPIGPNNTYIRAPLLKQGMLPFAQNFYPVPNGTEFLTSTGAPSGLASNFANPLQKIREDFGLARIDYVASTSDSFSASLLEDNGENDLPAADPLFSGVYHLTSRVFSLQETHIFSPTLLNVATFGFGSSFESTVTGPAAGVTIPASLDMLAGIGPGTIAIGGGPSATAASVTGAGGALLNPSTKNLFTWSDDVHLTKGSHSLSLGVWIQRVQENSYGPGANTTGGVSYPTLQAFLQDQPSTFLAVPSLNLLGFRTTETAWYVQDEIKLRPNLSLRLGLRDEMTTGFNEHSGRASNYIYDSNGIILQDPHVGPSAFTQNNAIALWQPRVGLAWDPTGSGKWSVRAAAGIYNDLQDNLAFRIGGNYPYGGRISVPGAMLSFIPFPVGPQSEPPPCNAALNAAHASCAIYAPEGVEPNMHTPTVQEWSFTVQREITNNLMIQLGYVGSQAYHLVNYNDMNAIMPQVCAAPQGCAAGGTKGAVSVVPQGTTYVPPGTLPNPYTSYTQSFWYNGVSSYHALHVSLVKRVSQGLSFKVNYAFSKVLDMDSGTVTRQTANEPGDTLNPYNLSLSKGPAAFNLQQQFNANFSYELPFGHGQRWAGTSSGLVDKLIGGWQWNGIITAQCGFPITPTTGANTSGTGDATNPDRPNWNPAFTGPLVTGNPHQWYNPAAFLLPTTGTFGNVARGSFQGPGLFSLDTSLFKEIRIREGLRLQFRAEVFNILNRANFGPPSIVAFSGSAVAASAGAITATSTTSRQIQFALKLTF
jgi:hypothetical protein